MIADEAYRQFHRTAAQQLLNLYGAPEGRPAGLSGILAWHWALAQSWVDATGAALDEAETLVAQQNMHDARRWCERAMEYLERLAAAERPPYALRTYSLAWTILDWGGQHEQALSYAERLRHAAPAGEGSLIDAMALLAQGRSHRALAQWAAAEECLRHAFDLARRLAHPGLETEALLHLGKTQQLQGKHTEALESFSAAHLRSGVLDDRAAIAKIVTSLGDVYRLLESHTEAIRHYNRALQLERYLPRTLGVAIVQEKRALSYLALGDYQQALSCQGESLLLREQNNDRVGMARAYNVLGMIHTVRGDHQTAIDAYKSSLELEESLHHLPSLESLYHRLGDAYRALGDYSESSAYYERALQQARSLNDTLGMALTCERLGDLAHDWTDNFAAAQHWSAAINLRQQLGHHEEQQRLEVRLRLLGGQS